MRDLIDRQAAIDALTHKWNGMVTSVFDVINSLPSAQLAQDLTKGCTDTISRQAAIDALDGNIIVTSRESAQAVMDYIRECADRIRSLPSAQPDLDEWCTDCKEYDKERNSCPRWNRVIKETLKDLQEERKMQLSEESTTFDCISRQAAIDAVCSSGDYFDMIERLNDLPSAQPEIIRCKECKHWKKTCGDESWSVGDCDFFDEKLVMCKGFCAWAERRTDETTI